MAARRSRASREVDQEEQRRVAQLRAAFDEIDTDGGGTLDLEEFTEAFRLASSKPADGEANEGDDGAAAAPPSLTDEQIETLFNRADVANQGALDFEAFVELMESGAADVLAKEHALEDARPDAMVAKDRLSRLSRASRVSRASRASRDSADSDGGELVEKLSGVAKDRELLARNVKETSLLLYWQRPQSSFAIAGYRIAYAIIDEKGKQQPWEITVLHSQDPTPSRMIVNLEPGTRYRFQVAAVHDHKNGPMLLSGSTYMSDPIRTKEQEYMKAWFFEDVEEVGNEWRMFFGDPMQDGPGGMNAKKMTQVDFRFIDMLAVEQSIEQCFTGRASMRISLPGEMPGGAMIDYSVKDARTYRIMARVYHSHPLPEGGAGALLRVWDHGDTWVQSAPGSKVGRWETLQVTVIGTRKYRIRIHIQCLEDYTGFVYVDQVEVHFAGRDRLGRLADELEAITQQPRINVGSVLHVRSPRLVGVRPAP